jgi:Nucleotidyl transferase AbiEii toxin, Type IV TA system
MARESYFDLVEGVHRMANPGPKVQRTLLEAYRALVDACRRSKIRFVLHGAFAMAAYGHERATRDVDFLVPADQRTVRTLFAAMDRLGAVPARPGPQSADEALRKHSDPASFNLAGWLIDFFFDRRFKSICSRAVRRRFGNRLISVISRRDLASRKAERGTLQDLADIEKLAAAEAVERYLTVKGRKRTKRADWKSVLDGEHEN